MKKFISILRKYTPLSFKHLFNSIYINSISGFILTKVYGYELSIDNIKIYIDNRINNYLYYSRIFFKKYERIEVFQINHFLDPCLDTIELGSGIGITSSHIIKKLNQNNKLICIEANPDLYKSLQKNLALNSSYKNFFTINKIINYDNKNIYFEKNENFLLSKVKITHKSKDKNSDNTITLREIIHKNNINYYNLVCDIEGNEVSILLEDIDILKNCKVLIVELHPTKYKNNIYNINDLEKIILDEGFRKIDDQHACKVFIR